MRLAAIVCLKSEHRNFKRDYAKEKLRASLRKVTLKNRKEDFRSKVLKKDFRRKSLKNKDREKRQSKEK
jgi:hypothetical protein